MNARRECTTRPVAGSAKAASATISFERGFQEWSRQSEIGRTKQGHDGYQIDKFPLGGAFENAKSSDHEQPTLRGSTSPVQIIDQESLGVYLAGK